MKKTLLLMSLSLLMIDIAPAQTPTQVQQIHRLADIAEQKLRNSGIDREFTSTTIAREEEALEAGKALANYMLRVCADKRGARALLKQAAAEQRSIDRSIAQSRSPNVIVINTTPFIPYIPDTAPVSRYFHPTTRHSTFSFTPDGTGGGSGIIDEE